LAKESRGALKAILIEEEYKHLTKEVLRLREKYYTWQLLDNELFTRDLFA
jgi:hypothetical protein